MSERTLILVKPDGVRRGLIGEVIFRIERKGLTMTVHYRNAPDRAGWAERLAEGLGSTTRVAGLSLNFRQPEPTGVVGVVAPAEPPLDGLVARVVPALVGGPPVYPGAPRAVAAEHRRDLVVVAGQVVLGEQVDDQRRAGGLGQLRL